MSKLVLILTATSVGCGVLSMHLVKQMYDGKETIATLQAKVAALEQQQANRPPAPVAVPAPPPVAEAVAANVPLAPPPKAAEKPNVAASAPLLPSREERMRMAREARDRQRQLMQDPEYRDAMRLQNRVNYARSYPGLADELGFGSQQADEFLELLSDQQMRASEAMEPLWDMEGRDPASMQEQQRKVQQQAQDLQRKSEAEIAARFGQDKLQQWKEYQSTLGARHQAEQMSSSLAAQDMPLSSDAQKSLIKAMAEVQKAEASEYAGNANLFSGFSAKLGASPAGGGLSEEFVERQLESTRKRNQRTLDAISPFLSYEQRQSIEREQEAQLKLQRAHLRLMRSQGNANWNGPGGSVQTVIAPSQ